MYWVSFVRQQTTSTRLCGVPARTGYPQFSHRPSRKARAILEVSRWLDTRSSTRRPSPTGIPLLPSGSARNDESALHEGVRQPLMTMPPDRGAGVVTVSADEPQAATRIDRAAAPAASE